MSWINSIKEYAPYNEQEENDKKVIINCLDRFDDILKRDNQIVHITSSAFVVNKNRDKILMVHHNIFNSWSLPGGHADGEENLLIVAINEVKEETGVKNLYPISTNIFSLDLLSVQGHTRKGSYVSPHLHISAVYLFEADENEQLVIEPDENSNVQWIPINEVAIYSNEPHMRKVYNKLISKFKEV